MFYNNVTGRPLLTLDAFYPDDAAFNFPEPTRETERVPSFPIKDASFVTIAKTLDIRRITSQIIVTGLCWKNRTEKSVHRNNIDAVQRFLSTRYKSRWMVWNLDRPDSYDCSVFNNQVVEFEISKSVNLTLRALFDICRSLHSWLSLDPKNGAYFCCISILENQISSGNLSNSCHCALLERKVEDGAGYCVLSSLCRHL